MSPFILEYWSYDGSWTGRSVDTQTEPETDVVDEIPLLPVVPHPSFSSPQCVYVKSLCVHRVSRHQVSSRLTVDSTYVTFLSGTSWVFCTHLFTCSITKDWGPNSVLLVATGFPVRGLVSRSILPTDLGPSRRTNMGGKKRGLLGSGKVHEKG